MLPETESLPVECYVLASNLRARAQLRDHRSVGRRRGGQHPPRRPGQEPRRVAAGQGRRPPCQAAGMNDDSDGAPAPAVRYAVTGGVATLTMDQPHTRNALSPALLDGLGRLFGPGPRRSTGPRGGGPQPHRPGLLCRSRPVGWSRDTRLLRMGPASNLAGILNLILESPQPVVARIAGHGFGGGVGLAAAWVTRRLRPTRRSSASPRSVSAWRHPSSRWSACRSCAGSMPSNCSSRVPVSARRGQPRLGSSRRPWRRHLSTPRSTRW